MSRVERLYQALDGEVDVIVLANDVEPFIDLSFYYFTGVRSGLFEGCVAFAYPDGRLELHTSPLEETSARESLAEVKVYQDKDQRQEMIAEALSGAKRIGVNGAGLTHRLANTIGRTVSDAELVDVWEAVERVRMIKDPSEIDAVSRACAIAGQVAGEIPSLMEPGVRESDLAAEISYRMQRLGASGNSFPPICAFGSNAAEPHYLSGDRKLDQGETALFDFGCIYQRYASDITRTFFLGHVDDEMRRAYEVVLDAQQAGLDAIAPGVMAREVDAAARGIIDATEFQGRFIHSFGHGVGLSVHDPGSLSPRSQMVLKENMVLTAEPGIYLPGMGGIRIEDTVVVTSSGYRILTLADKDLRVV